MYSVLIIANYKLGRKRQSKSKVADCQPLCDMDGYKWLHSVKQVWVH